MNRASAIFDTFSSTLYTYNWNARKKEGVGKVFDEIKNISKFDKNHKIINPRNSTSPNSN